MERYIVDPFAIQHYGEYARYGWRVIDRAALGGHGRILTVHPTEGDAQILCDTLNSWEGGQGYVLH